MNRRDFSILLPLVAASVQARAQGVDKPIRFVVPFPPGGGMDIVARTLADKLSKQLNQQFIVDNRPGAGSILGTQIAINSTDGRTFLVTANNLTINPQLYKKLPYDSKNLEAVTRIAQHPFVLIANPNKGFRTVAELIGVAKSRPGKITYASAGIATPHHLVMEIFANAAGLEIVHVPYQGSTPALSDLVGGNVDIMFNGISPSFPFIQSGQLIALGVDTRLRAAVLPNVPSLTEAGLPESKTVSWSAVFAPKSTAPELVRKMVGAIETALQDPQMREKLEGLGLQPAPMSGPQWTASLAAEERAWGEVIKRTGAVAQ